MGGLALAVATGATKDDTGPQRNRRVCSEATQDFMQF